MSFSSGIPWLEKGLFHKLRRDGNKIRFLVFRQFPFYHFGMHYRFPHAEIGIFIFQYLSLVKHMA